MPSQGHQGDSKANVSRGSAPESYRFADQIDGAVIMPHLMRDHAPSMQHLEVARIAAEDFLVDLFRLGEPARTMQRDASLAQGFKRQDSPLGILSTFVRGRTIQGNWTPVLSDAVADSIARAARLISHGRLPEAERAYEEILGRWPELPDCWYNLAHLQRRLRRFDAALESYARALVLGVNRPEEVHLNRGVIFSDCLHQDAAAERELNAALALNPTYLPALQNLANLHADRGNQAAARGLYERMLQLEPRSYQALARLAQLTEIERPGEHPLVGRLRAALADAAASHSDRASLGFALAGLLDAGGLYRAAFAAAEGANRESRASTPHAARYDRRAQERFIDALIEAFPRPRTLPPAQVSVASPAAQPPRPIFICGMFRSGSTLTEQLLAGHPQVAAGGELDMLPGLLEQYLRPFPAAVATATDAQLAQLATSYLAGIRALFPGSTCVTDKRPDNFTLIGLIKTLFPLAKIVHTTRDPLDTCLSIFFLHLDPRIPYALNLLDTGHYLRQHQRLMAHWRSLYSEDLLEFNYDRLVHDPRAAAQQLLRFCGLEWSESVLDTTRSSLSVKTASVWQVRRPLHTRSSGRARHYLRELRGLRSYLAS
jgi:tetratricopeptide (TPR) repeat protein